MSLWDKVRNRWFGCGRDGTVRHVNWWDNEPSWFSRFLNGRLRPSPEERLPLIPRLPQVRPHPLRRILPALLSSCWLL